MQKHGLSESEIGGAKDGSSAEIVVKRVAVTGKYRVQRQNLLYVIARHHSCVGYRDDDDGDACVVVLYGRESDIFAAETIFATADLLGIRLALHPDWRRCSSLTYAQYARSSRLATRAHRHPRCSSESGS